VLGVVVPACSNAALCSAVSIPCCGRISRWTMRVRTPSTSWGMLVRGAPFFTKNTMAASPAPSWLEPTPNACTPENSINSAPCAVRAAMAFCKGSGDNAESGTSAVKDAGADGNVQPITNFGSVDLLSEGSYSCGIAERERHSVDS
jgi:hypothetical protein